MAETSGDKPTQFSLLGRHIYLEVLHEHWPEVLSALRRDVFPSFVPPENPLSDVVLPSPDGPLYPMPRDQWSRIENDPALAGLIEKIRYWAEHFDIRDSWILDAALQTMNWNHKMHEVTNCWEWWLYSELSTPPFTPTFRQCGWIPPDHGGRETWEKFSARIVSELKRQLADYRRAVNKRWGIGTSEMRRDAIWTVLSHQPANLQVPQRKTGNAKETLNERPCA